MNTLPISVVVPHKTSRDEFFHSYCLPSIEANHPSQIIIEENDGSDETGSRSRNIGAAKATQPHLFFCDDDIILHRECLSVMLETIFWSEARYVYCDYQGICIPPGKHPLGNTFIQRGMKFDKFALRRGNFISPMSLMERSIFQGFDETLKRYDDWEFWLSVLDKGIEGLYIPRVLFMAFYLDSGVTDAPDIPSVHAIQRKHGIPVGG